MADTVVNVEGAVPTIDSVETGAGVIVDDMLAGLASFVNIVPSALNSALNLAGFAAEKTEEIGSAITEPVFGLSFSETLAATGQLGMEAEAALSMIKMAGGLKNALSVGKAIGKVDDVLAAGSEARLIGVPQNAFDRMMARLQGLRVGDKPVVQQVEFFGSRSGSTFRGRGPTATSDLDTLLTVDQSLMQGRQGDWIRRVMDSIQKDFASEAGFPLSLHAPPNVGTFKQSIPGATFIPWW